MFYLCSFCHKFLWAKASSTGPFINLSIPAHVCEMAAAAEGPRVLLHFSVWCFGVAGLNNCNSGLVILGYMIWRVLSTKCTIKPAIWTSLFKWADYWLHNDSHIIFKNSIHYYGNSFFPGQLRDERSMSCSLFTPSKPRYEILWKLGERSKLNMLLKITFSSLEGTISNEDTNS